jgi:hypothetical protein
MQISTRLRFMNLMVSAGLGLGAVPLAAQGKLEQCETPIGTIAVVEPENLVAAALLQYNLPSPTSLIRMMIQKSHCFLVVERGVAMSNLMQERELARSGQLQQQSNVGGGQLRAADFILTPNVIFSEGNGGGVMGAIASSAGGIFGAVAAAGLKFKEAQTSILVSDTRTGLQVASAEAKARKTDFALGGIAGLGGIGAYSNTNEGKVIAASFLTNYNKIVAVMWDDSSLVRLAPKQSAAASARPATADGLVEGDVLSPKIDSVRILEAPSATARVVATVRKVDDVVYLGLEKDGFLRVESAHGTGWVRKMLVSKK